MAIRHGRFLLTALCALVVAGCGAPPAPRPTPTPTPVPVVRGVNLAAFDPCSVVDLGSYKDILNNDRVTHGMSFDPNITVHAEAIDATAHLGLYGAKACGVTWHASDETHNFIIVLFQPYTSISFIRYGAKPQSGYEAAKAQEVLLREGTTYIVKNGYIFCVEDTTRVGKVLALDIAAHHI